MDKKNIPGSMGLSLLLPVFFTLVLSLLAALTVSTAQKDAVLSEEYAHRKSEYYSALSAADEDLSDIDGILASVYAGAENESTYFEILSRELTQNDSYEYSAEDKTLSFYTIINGRQSLYISLDLSYPSAGETYYSVRACKSVSSTAFEADNRLNLISFDN